MRFDERAFMETVSLAGAQHFSRCRRCGDEFPYQGQLVGMIQRMMPACEECGGSGILPGVVNERCPRCNPMPGAEAAAEDEDEGAAVRSRVNARRRSATRAAHEASGLCTMHNGSRYCGRSSHVLAENVWPPRHELSGPPVD